MAFARQLQHRLTTFGQCQYGAVDCRRCFASPPRSGLIEFLDLNPTDVPAGRSWLIQELRLKSFEDLQKLWYVCYKEQNMLLSEQARKKLDGKRLQHWDRMKSVKQTMARIKHVLSDRAREKLKQAESLRKDGPKLRETGEQLRVSQEAVEQRWRALRQSGLDDLARINAK